MKYNKVSGQTPLRLSGKIIRKEDESIDDLLKRLKKAVIKGEIISDYKKHQEYTAPSLARKRKHENAVKRNNKLMRKKEKFYC